MAAEVEFESIAVVGLGLLGASICHALRARSSTTRLVAIDKREVVSRSEAAGLADQLLIADDAAAVRKAAAASQVTVLCTPVAVICQTLPTFLEHAPVVTDCGSTKREIVRAAASTTRSERFVPGHPMAGGPRGGLSEARADLFTHHRWILCSDCGSPEAQATVQQLVRLLGAEPISMTASEHDRAVALTSHLPQLFASALVALARARGAQAAIGPSYLGTTRGAGGNPAMWHDIFATNADQIAPVARQLADTLRAVADDLERGEISSALRVLEAAREGTDE